MRDEKNNNNKIKQEINQRLNIEILKTKSYVINQSQNILVLGLAIKQDHEVR